MNAPLRRLPTDLAPIEEVFAARCEARALLHLNGLLSLHDAVDELQAYAEQSGIIDTLGQDEAQAIMSYAFCAVDFVPEAAEDPGAADVVRSLELADPRDRWRHTGEAPPPAEVRNGPLQPEPARAPPYRTPQSTIDAFWYVTQLDDSDYLGAWLANHPQDRPHLFKLWKAKQC